MLLASGQAGPGGASSSSLSASSSASEADRPDDETHTRFYWLIRVSKNLDKPHHTPICISVKPSLYFLSENLLKQIRYTLKEVSAFKKYYPGSLQLRYMPSPLFVIARQSLSC